MTQHTIIEITPDSADWPPFAPSWSRSALLDADEKAFTFSRSWEIPSLYRDAEPLIAIRVEQSFTHSRAMDSWIAGEPWLEAGSSGAALWADWRREEIASVLRDIADALAPQTTAGEVMP